MQPSILNFSMTRSKQLCVLLIILVSIAFIFLSVRFHREVYKPSLSPSFYIPVQHQSNLSLPSLCVITRIYGPQIRYFPVFALSLRLSGLNDLRIYAVNTDSRTDLSYLRRTIDFINTLVQEHSFVTLLDLGPLPAVNQFGYGVTDQALRYLYEQQAKNTSNCDYIMVTNGYNLYTKNFGVKILPHMKEKYDIIGWGFVSHHYKGHFRETFNEKKNFAPKFIDDGTEKCTPSTLHVGQIDLGAATYRVAFLSKHQLYFRMGNNAYSMGSDGHFVEQAIRHTNASIVLRQTIFIHQ